MQSRQPAHSAFPGSHATAAEDSNHFRVIPPSLPAQSVEGRKIWFATKVTDGPEGTVFAEARTLFIVARKDEEEPSNGEGE